jgi:hypothetical protein
MLCTRLVVENNAVQEGDSLLSQIHMNLYQLQEILAPPTLLQSVIGNPHVISQ